MDTNFQRNNPNFSRNSNMGSNNPSNQQQRMNMGLNNLGALTDPTNNMNMMGILGNSNDLQSQNGFPQQIPSFLSQASSNSAIMTNNFGNMPTNLNFNSIQTGSFTLDSNNKWNQSNQIPIQNLNQGITNIMNQGPQGQGIMFTNPNMSSNTMGNLNMNILTNNQSLLQEMNSRNVNQLQQKSKIANIQQTSLNASNPTNQQINLMQQSNPQQRTQMVDIGRIDQSGNSSDRNLNQKNEIDDRIKIIYSYMTFLVRYLTIILHESYIPKIEEVTRSYFQGEISGNEVKKIFFSMIQESKANIPENIQKKINSKIISYDDLIKFFSSEMKNKFLEAVKNGTLKDFLEKNSWSKPLEKLYQLKQVDSSLRKQKSTDSNKESSNQLLGKKDEGKMPLQSSFSIEGKKLRNEPESDTKNNSITPRDHNLKHGKDSVAKKTPKTHETIVSFDQPQQSEEKKDGNEPKDGTNDTDENFQKRDDLELENYINLFTISSIDLERESELLSRHIIGLRENDKKIFSSKYFNSNAIHERVKYIANNNNIYNISGEVGNFISLALEYHMRNIIDQIVNIAQKREFVEKSQNTSDSQDLDFRKLYQDYINDSDRMEDISPKQSLSITSDDFFYALESDPFLSKYAYLLRQKYYNKINNSK